MCDYCDGRRISEIADLGAEHEITEQLADDVLALARSGSPRLEEDHRRCGARPADPHLDTEGLEEPFDDLHRHLAIEEYDLFPAAVQVLKREAMAV